ncbi:GntR family transcriptional regulator [Streptosporangium sp. V21-05]|uniref:GntR family transcriptional regulator n=1 Tax=Streptosporangium sp. V21-05 TaxID=3446115 RepID=UPI003F53BD3B
MVEQVTDELRRSILSGALTPGQEYSLRELAGLLEVSFIPVREALRILESEGLVHNRPGRSVKIMPLDLADLHGIYRLRRAIEPNLARQSCTELTDEALDALEAEAAGFGDEAHGMADIYENHHAFHFALLAPAATAWDIRILTTLWHAAERYIRIGFGHLDPDPAEHRRRGQAHTDLVAAFRTRDPDTAATAIERHLARNEQIALGALASDTAQAPGHLGTSSL